MNNQFEDNYQNEATIKLLNFPKTLKILEENPEVARLVDEAKIYIPPASYSHWHVYEQYKRRVLSLIKEPDAGHICAIIERLLPQNCSDVSSEQENEEEYDDDF